MVRILAGRGRLVPPRRHPFVDGIQALGLRERGNFVVGREALHGVLERLLAAGEGAEGQGARGRQALQLQHRLGLLAQHGEDARHLADGTDLVADHLLAQRRLVVRERLLALLGHELVVGADVQHVHQHLGDLLAHEGQRPGEHVHEVGQPVRVRRAVELPDVHHVVLVLQHRRLVVVHVEIVGRREDGDQRGEAGGLALAVHAVAGVLRLVRPDDRQQVVVLQEVAAGGVAVEVRAAAHGVVRVEVRVLLVAEVLQWVRPQQVAHGAEGGRLLEAVEPPNVLQLVYLGRKAAVHAQELLVHERRQRQAVERVHAGVVHALRVLDLALLLEGEVLGQVPALVVAAQQEQRLRIGDLQRPQIQDALDAEVAPIDVVAQEQILGGRRRATDLEQLHQVVELAVYVAAHRHRRLDVNHRLFRAQ
ncbi:hypothetical protein M5D96_012181 [Drosophila gunungcola]|uniref:Uncharacterized protein n=1 Tax=Drosophila gunungcola TaxID=103775 RepID=A0A9P9YDT0_9MUSC|nr:hypothetical protein M5D96_012181 [Drosophila gunungcola]